VTTEPAGGKQPDSRRHCHAFSVALLCLGLFCCNCHHGAVADSYDVRLGEQQTFLGTGAHGLHYFPDAHLTFLDTEPLYRVFLVAGVRTWLMEGRDMRSLAPVGDVLRPGEAGTFDNGYTGIFGAYEHAKSGELLALYHAEDHENMPRLPSGVPGFYACIGLAVSRDRGVTSEKLGPALTGSKPKDVSGRGDQGVGEGSLLVDATNTYLYCYYTDHSRVEGRGVQICVARSPISSRGRRGTWQKYYERAFSEPGLGGRDTPVLSAQHMQADVVFPHVTYVPQLGKYLVVFCIVAYADLKTLQPETSGIYLATSADGVHWSEPTLMLPALTIPRRDHECAWHPTLAVESVAQGSLKGWLYYAYSERWGGRDPRKPHYLVGRPITITSDRDR